MTKESFWVKNLTPKDTEEVKPGLFIQRKLGKYRQVSPAAWDGKINKRNLFLGSNPLKHLFIFGLIVFIAWAYQNDVQVYQDFYVDVRGDPIGYCDEVRKAVLVGCSIEQEANGFCIRNGLVNYSLGNLEVVNEESTKNI